MVLPSGMLQSLKTSLNSTHAETGTSNMEVGDCRNREKKERREMLTTSASPSLCKQFLVIIIVIERVALHVLHETFEELSNLMMIAH